MRLQESQSITVGINHSYSSRQQHAAAPCHPMLNRSLPKTMPTRSLGALLAPVQRAPPLLHLSVGASTRLRARRKKKTKSPT